MHNQGTDVPLAKGQGCRRRGADPPAVVSPSIPVTGHPVFCRGFYFDGNLVALSEGGEIPAVGWSLFAVFPSSGWDLAPVA